MLKILDVKINPINKEELLKKFEQFLETKKPHLVCTVNTEFIVSAQNDTVFKDILNNKSAINVTDGVGVMWAAKFLSLNYPRIPVIGTLTVLLQWLLTGLLVPLYPRYFFNPIPARLAGSDLTWDIAKMANKNGKKIFLLGGAPTAAERAALVLQTKIYGLKIAGIHSGNPKDDTSEMVEAINKAKVDILLVAFGHPKQEKWLDQNMKKLSCQLCIGVGGTFDFIAGIQKRAPKWVQNIGMEWLYRLIREPKRFPRQTSILKFIFLVLKEKMKG